MWLKARARHTWVNCTEWPVVRTYVHGHLRISLFISMCLCMSMCMCMCRHRDMSSSSSPSAKIVTHGKDNTSCTNAFICVDTMDLEQIAVSANGEAENSSSTNHLLRLIGLSHPHFDGVRFISGHAKGKALHHQKLLLTRQHRCMTGLFQIQKTVQKNKDVWTLGAKKQISNRRTFDHRLAIITYAL